MIKKRITNRQNYLDKYFFITGSLFFFTKNFIFKYKKLFNEKSIAYEVDRINFVDIDDKLTYEMSKNLKNLKFRK